MSYDFSDLRAAILVINETGHELYLSGVWNDNDDKAENWVGWNTSPNYIYAGCQAAYFLADNDRAALAFKLESTYYCMGFTIPKSSGNNAEGSYDTKYDSKQYGDAGLGVYADSDDPILIVYRVGTANHANWEDSESNDPVNPPLTCAYNAITNSWW